MRRIVVTLASCPTRLLGPYGCEWVETPTLDRLAAEGVVFDQHILDRPAWTRVATAPADGRSRTVAIQPVAGFGEAVIDASGAVDSLVERLWEETGERGHVVATGGLSQLLVGHSRTIEKADPDELSLAVMKKA